MKGKLLYLEDDIDLAFLTTEALSSREYLVDHFTKYDAAKKAFDNDKYDVCILDVVLEEKKDGYDFLQYIRNKNRDVPVLMLTAKVQEEDRIKGLKYGADDYVVKPFSIEELELRIDVFLRRNKVFSPLSQRLNIGAYTFQPTEQKLILNGEERKLTQRETEVLAYLSERQNTIIKREDILEDIWGKNDYFLGRSLDVFITKLRKYLEDDHNIEIETLHRVGFRLNIE